MMKNSILKFSFEWQWVTSIWQNISVGGTNCLNKFSKNSFKYYYKRKIEYHPKWNLMYFYFYVRKGQQHQTQRNIFSEYYYVFVVLTLGGLRTLENSIIFLSMLDKFVDSKDFATVTWFRFRLSKCSILHLENNLRHKMTSHMHWTKYILKIQKLIKMFVNLVYMTIMDLNNLTDFEINIQE